MAVVQKRSLKACVCVNVHSQIPGAREAPYIRITAMGETYTRENVKGETYTRENVKVLTLESVFCHCAPTNY